jgi:hypothetical protein
VNADEILAADEIVGGSNSLKAVPVPVDEWKPGSLVHVAELTADERDELEEEWSKFREKLNEEGSNVGFRSFVVAWCLCDALRNRLFAGKEAAAAQSIGANRNGKATARVFNVAARINGLLKEDIDALEKNSGAAPPEAANSDGSGESPSRSAARVGKLGSAKSRAKNTRSS